MRLPTKAASLLAGTALAAAAVVVLQGGQAAQAGTPTVTLTSTLAVGIGDTLSDTHYVWAGPSTDPIIELKSTAFAVLENLQIEVAPGHHASSAIHLVDNPPNGGAFNNDIRDIKIGKPGQPGNFDYGMRWTGVMNGDSNTMTNIAVYGAALASFSLADAQATTNTFRSIFSFDTQVGFESNTGGAIQCENCRFTRSSNVDIRLTEGSRLILTGVYSTGSKAFAHLTAGNAAGGLSVFGGTFEAGPAASGPTITGVNSNGGPFNLRLQDFAVTPLGTTPAGSVTGFTEVEKYFSNVAGIA